MHVFVYFIIISHFLFWHSFIIPTFWNRMRFLLICFDLRLPLHLYISIVPRSSFIFSFLYMLTFHGPWNAQNILDHLIWGSKRQKNVENNMRKRMFIINNKTIMCECFVFNFLQWICMFLCVENYSLSDWPRFEYLFRRRNGWLWSMTFELQTLFLWSILMRIQMEIINFSILNPKNYFIIIINVTILMRIWNCNNVSVVYVFDATIITESFIEFAQKC